MELVDVVRKLEDFAPKSLAGSWDNVGLLIEPLDKRPITRILLTNDLTEPVMTEAVQKGFDMIISYHPPIFKPLKRLTSKNWKERIAIRCLENRIALYSPHTSWDAVKGGINEWLLLPFGPGKIEACERQESADPVAYTLDIPGAAQSVICDRRTLDKQFAGIPEELRSSVRITKHEPHPLLGIGAGRVAMLDNPLSLREAVAKIKAHLKLKYVRLALSHQSGLDSLVRRVGVCAGSGGSVLVNTDADLVLTGEMSHHEVLDFVHRGVSVVLTDHSNTERGFHSYIREELENVLERKVEVLVSHVDQDPLVVV